MRGPHRDAMSSSTTTTTPPVTAFRSSQPGRAATVSGDLAEPPSARKIEIGVGLDDRLGRELRIVAGDFLEVGDVLQTEQRVDLADERVLGDAVVRVVELVVVGQRRRRLGACASPRRRCRSASGHQLGRFSDVAGGRAELFDLGVHVVERRRRAARPTFEAERFELLASSRVVPSAITTRSGSARRWPRRSARSPRDRAACRAPRGG